MLRVVKHPLTVIAVLAAVTKLIITFQLADHPLLSEDSGLDTTAYAELARRIANGDLLLGPGLYYLSPLYMYVLGAGLAVTDSFTAVRIMQVFAGVGALVGIWSLTRAWSDERAATWAAGLAALTGIVTFYEILILQASIDVALTTASLLALTWALRRPATWWPMVAGSTFGVASLNRPNMILVAVGLGLLMFATRRIRGGLLFAVGVAMALAPVAVRNGVVAGEWLTVSSHGGLNLYIGNGPGATGFYRLIPGIRPTIAGQAHDAREVAGRALGRPVSDSEASDYFTNQVWTWAVGSPGEAAALFAKKLGFVFHGSHVPLPYSFAFYVHETDSLLRYLPVGPWLLAPLGLVGLALLLRNHRGDTAAWIWVAFVPLYASSVALFFVADRYRLPLIVPLCVGSGIALSTVACRVRAGQWRAVALPVVAAVLLFVPVNWPAGLNDGRWDEGLKLAQRLVILGRDADATRWVERLEHSAPSPGRARHLVGRQYLVEGRPGLALPLLKRAHDDGLRGAQLLGDLASALNHESKFSEAVGILKAITPSEVEGPDFWLGLGRLASTLQEPELAGGFFAFAVGQAPENPDARLQFGVNLVVRSRLIEAATELRAALALDARQPDALAYLAFCEMSAGNFTETRRLIDAALEIEPSHGVALAVRAAIPR